MSGSGKKIEDHFATGEDFEEVLESAERDATTSYALDQCAKWRRTWENFGMRAFMTEQQHANLCALAGVDPDS